MNESRRQQKVSSLIKTELSGLLMEVFQGKSNPLITITRVEMSRDLKTARIFVTFLGRKMLPELEIRKKYIRKHIASRVKLKYNPMLIFFEDPTPDIEEKLDGLLIRIKNEE